MSFDGFSAMQFGAAPQLRIDGRTPIEIWKRPKRGMPPDAPRIHYILRLASGDGWHSTPEFTGICPMEEAMAGFNYYEFVPIPLELRDGAFKRLLDEMSAVSQWAGNDNCQHKVNWIAFGERRSPTYNNWVLAAVLAGVGLAIATDSR